jgi:hypothetical protein
MALNDQRAQVWELGGGIGKSRIAATLGMMLLSTSAYTRVYFVIPNRGLIARDREEFKSYWRLSQHESNVEYVDGINFKPKAKSVVIVDEADFIMFRDLQNFKTFASKQPTICFTATPPEGDTDDLERKTYDQLALKSFNYWPSRLDRPKPINDTTCLKKMTDQELHNYIVTRAQD